MVEFSVDRCDFVAASKVPEKLQREGAVICRSTGYLQEELGSPEKIAEDRSKRCPAISQRTKLLHRRLNVSYQKRCLENCQNEDSISFFWEIIADQLREQSENSLIKVAADDRRNIFQKSSKIKIFIETFPGNKLC